MSHPIYLMALVTTLVSLAVWGTILWQLSPRDARRKQLLLMVLLGLGMSPLAYMAVRVPLLLGVIDPLLKRPGWDVSGWSALRDIIRLAYAPLTEEPAKLFPWLVLLACGWPLWPARKLLAPLSLAAGLGFALGEIWLVAWLVAAANDPQLAVLPWYAFGGFFQERLMTCLAHTLFALPTFVGWRRSRVWGCAGLGLGMLLHWLANAPIVLSHRQTFGWTPAVWSVVLQLWVMVFAVSGLVALIATTLGRKAARKMWARRMICPGCGAVYRQTLFYGLNFGLRRYERCSACRRWHWVTLDNLAPDQRPRGRATADAPSVEPPKKSV